jgi:hypothetical protein
MKVDDEKGRGVAEKWKSDDEKERFNAEKAVIAAEITIIRLFSTTLPIIC